ncbi:MaoC family dehydratase [Pedomonas mirosovicensis]|uniref:MaoC family dehydratase n=1 Tax=Pedomonas mirosovicensis TaxID=2908641 RepID=UPI00216766A7|nr:MaoC family dehydratase [Pedomonas mirosovicensis]MCH8685518.1 MaoC family dehydratase [Pedomonas mirosovicensis]
MSDWTLVDQPLIDRFAEVTRDFQFIHVDEARAKATPLGGTIAHGMLTLSLLPGMAEGVIPPLAGGRMTINYGFNRVRFLNPVRSGKQVRGRFTLRAVDDSQAGRVMVTFDATVEIEGEDKPALVAEWVGLTIL